MSDNNDALDDLLGARKPRRNAGDALDEMIAATKSTRDAGAALDDLISASGARPHGTPPEDRAAVRRRWVMGLAIAVGLLGFSGVVTDSVAVTQLVGDSSPTALALVFPLGGFGLVLMSIFQSRFIDRYARKSVLVSLCVIYATIFAAVLVLFATSAPTKVPAAIGVILADQMSFMLPLLIWTLAGDVFTAGQAVTVYPVITRWLYSGMILGFGVSTVTGIVSDHTGFSPAWLLVAPPVFLLAVAVFVPRILHDATLSEGHGKDESSSESMKASLSLLKDLPAFKWMLGLSFAVMAAGAIIEFGFFDVANKTVEKTGSLQAIYAAVFCGVLILSWAVQTWLSSPLMNRAGIGKVLQILPVATLLAAGVMVVAGATEKIAVAIVAIALWRTPRGSIDFVGRQAAMATVPDNQRARFSNLVNVVPVGVGFMLVAGPIGLSRLADNAWVAPIVAAVLALLAVLAGVRLVKKWDDTQLSYRLKRRKRLG
jgi:hypothetical protein